MDLYTAEHQVSLTIIVPVPLVEVWEVLKEQEQIHLTRRKTSIPINVL
jgi:hypothetical protein